METTLLYDLFTYLIIGMAIFIAARKVFNKSFKKSEASSCADGCGGCSTKCDLKELATQNK